MDFNTMPLETALWAVPLLVFLVLWSSVWKGFALYRAGRVQQPVWFVVLMILNTAGILEILYLFVFSKKPNTA